MKIGYFINGQYPANESMPQKIQDSVELVRAVRDAGFDLICAGQHYLSAPFQMSATLPLLARMAAEAGDMQVAATVVLLPLHNPVDLAESVATMDAICGGRFVFGIGLGYRDEEYMAFGVDRSERVERMNESLELMKLLWTEDEVEFHGKYYNVPKVKPATKPVQKPYPPIWVAANNDVAIRRAARWGYPWLINPHATVPMVAGQFKTYTANLEKFGQPIPETLPMMRELYVASDRESAFIESQPYLETKYAAYAAWGQDKALPGNESFSVPYQDLAKDRFLLGSPDEVAQEMLRYQDELGVNYLIFRMQWPGM
ncbi:MAG TPA: LLM class flavin-dependent oxidoreductase, partial [Dehalococcoidia bacterium]|nr:LLM class flavin-dependent oxidoreductase [Dehalococcoidia bacterium]